LEPPGLPRRAEEFNHFNTNGVPKQEGAACTYDFKKLYSEDPVGTGGVRRSSR